jgi:GNAT superfamily N-acetyltransferase
LIDADRDPLLPTFSTYADTGTSTVWTGAEGVNTAFAANAADVETVRELLTGDTFAPVVILSVNNDRLLASTRITVNDEVVGDATVRINPAERSLTISGLTISEAARNNGTGTSVVAGLTRNASTAGFDQVFTYVDRDDEWNPRLAYLYARAGFDWADSGHDQFALADPADSSVTRAQAAVRRWVDANPASPLVADAQALADRLVEPAGGIPVDASALPSDFPSPDDVAMFGWTPGAVSWPGQEMIGDFQWNGRMVVGRAPRPDAYRPVLRFERTRRDGDERLSLTSAQMRDIYTMDLGDGYYTTASAGSGGVSGVVYNSGGQAVGSFSRSYNLSNRSIYHSSFTMYASARGNGIGSRFISESIRRAEEAGFETITVSAAAGGDYNGSYTWARTGFDWSDPGRARDFAGYLEGILNDLEAGREQRFGEVPPAIIADGRDLIRRARLVSTDPEFPTPNDFAVFGWEIRDQGQRHIGKAVMARSGWSGTMRLRPRPPSPRRRERVGLQRDVQVELENTDVAAGFTFANLTGGRVGPDLRIDAEPDADRFESTVTEIVPSSGDEQFVTVIGNIDTPDGDNTLGSFTRHLYPDGLVQFDAFDLDPTIQNRGIGSQFLAQQIAELQRLGFNRIQVTATGGPGANGAYTYARAGFDWTDRASAAAMADTLAQIARTNNVDARYGENVRREIDEMIGRLRDWTGDDVTARPPAGFPLPNDVAMLGWQPGTDSWFGKDLLTGNFGSIAYDGILFLNPVVRPSERPWSRPTGRAAGQRRVTLAAARGDRVWDVSVAPVTRAATEVATARLQALFDSAPDPSVLSDLEFVGPRGADGLPFDVWLRRHGSDLNPAIKGLLENFVRDQRSRRRGREVNDRRRLVRALMRDEDAISTAMTAQRAIANGSGAQANVGRGRLIADPERVDADFVQAAEQVFADAVGSDWFANLWAELPHSAAKPHATVTSNENFMMLPRMARVERGVASDEVVIRAVARDTDEPLRRTDEFVAASWMPPTTADLPEALPSRSGRSAVAPEGSAALSFDITASLVEAWLLQMEAASRQVPRSMRQRTDLSPSEARRVRQAKLFDALRVRFDTLYPSTWQFLFGETTDAYTSRGLSDVFAVLGAMAHHNIPLPADADASIRRVYDVIDQLMKGDLSDDMRRQLTDGL